jgi:hypothetical protein
MAGWTCCAGRLSPTPSMAPPRESHDNSNDYERQRQDEEGFGQSEGHTDVVYQTVGPFVLAGRSGLDVVRRAA